MSVSNVWERNEDFAWEKVDDGVVVIDLTRQKVFELNQGAAWLWDAMEKPRSKTELALEVTRKHDLEYDDVIKDVESFLEMTISTGLLQKKEHRLVKIFKKLRKTIRILIS